MKRLLTKLFLFLMSHIQEVRKSNQQVSDEIRAVLRITPEALYWLKVDSGRQYLDYILGPDQGGREELINSKVFWGWFINKWIEADEKLLKDDEWRVTLHVYENAIENYRSYHRQRMRLSNIPTIIKESKKLIKQAI